MLWPVPAKDSEVRAATRSAAREARRLRQGWVRGADSRARGADSRAREADSALHEWAASQGNEEHSTLLVWADLAAAIGPASLHPDSLHPRHQRWAVSLAEVVDLVAVDSLVVVAAASPLPGADSVAAWVAAA